VPGRGGCRGVRVQPTRGLHWQGEPACSGSHPFCCKWAGDLLVKSLHGSACLAVLQQKCPSVEQAAPSQSHLAVAWPHGHTVPRGTTSSVCGSAAAARRAQLSWPNGQHPSPAAWLSPCPCPCLSRLRLSSTSSTCRGLGWRGACHRAWPGWLAVRSAGTSGCMGGPEYSCVLPLCTCRAQLTRAPTG